MLSSSDAQLVQRDPVLPGLATLLDPEAFAAVLSESLPEDFGNAQCNYVRYKPGTSCLAAYRVRAGDKTVDLYAKAYPVNVHGKLEKAAILPQVSGSQGPGRVVLGDRGLVISFFPNDWRLTSLFRLGEPALRRSLLAKLFPRRPDLWEGSLHTLRYKPERRYVARLDTDKGSQAVIKFYASSEYEAASQKAVKPNATVCLAKRLARSRRHHVIAWEWLPGRLLSDMLSNGEATPDDLIKVGRALAGLHRQKRRTLRCRTRESEAKSLLALAANIAFLCPSLASRVQQLAGRLAQRFVKLPQVRQPIHGDFHAKQILISDSVAVIDFDETALGDPAMDIGNFAAHLYRDAFCDTISKRVEWARAALLEGYQSAAESPGAESIDLYIAAGLLRVAPHPFRSREAQWVERTKTLVEQAESILCDGPGAPSSSESSCQIAQSDDA